MELLQAVPYVVTETVDWCVEIRKALIVAAPVILVTWLIWYLSGLNEKRRERIKLASQLSASCRKYTLLHHEHEKNKIEFQLRSISYKYSDKDQKENALRALENSRNASDNFKLLRLEETTEITKLNVQLVIYATKSQANKLNDLITEASKISVVGDFKNDFKDIKTIAEAIEKKKQLIAELDTKLFKEGYGKKYEEIRDFLVTEFVNKKLTL